MADILSQEEVEAMLSAIADDDEQEESFYPFLSTQRQIALYDFKRPCRVSKNQLRAFRRVHDLMARALEAKLSEKLKYNIETQLHSVDQMTYGEFLMSLPNPTSFNIAKMNPLEGKIVIEVNPSIAFPIIDRLLGGQGEPYEETRSFSVTEQKIFSHFLDVIETSLESGWKDVIETEFVVDSQNGSPNAIQIVAQNEIVVMVIFEIIIGYSSGMMNICYPVSMIEQLLPVMSGATDPIENDKLIFDKQLIGQIEVEVEAVIGKTMMPLEDILKLKVDDAIIFPETDPNETNVSLELENKAIGVCKMGSSGFKKEINLITKVIV